MSSGSKEGKAGFAGNGGIVALLWVALMLSAFMTQGCPPADKKPVVDKTPTVEQVPPTGFTWDTVRLEPRWRLAGPIKWHRTSEKDAVIQESDSGQKAILCYVSRYDSGLTETIEGGLFRADSFGQQIADNMITWEINWWDDPGLAQRLMGASEAPALLVLKPSPDAGTDGFAVIDRWVGEDLRAFPLHGEPTPPTSADAQQRMKSFWSSPRTIQSDIAGLAEAFQTSTSEEEMDAFLAAQRGKLNAVLAGTDGFFPEECLYSEYRIGSDEALSGEIRKLIDEWHEFSDPEGGWLPDKAFSSETAWLIDPYRNLLTALCAMGVGTSWPLDSPILMESVKDMVILQDGNLGGGFPAYIDIRNTFEEGPDYVSDTSGPKTMPGRKVTGPRDIVWVNARALAAFLRVVASDPEISKLELAPDLTANDLVDRFSGEMAKSLLERAGDVGEMSFVDRVYLLDMLNQMYQRTADIEFLRKAGDIAATFDPGKPQEWFDPRMSPFLPDLAIALHQYGWLAEDEKARSAADLVTELAIRYAGMFGEMDRMRLAYAHEVVHSKCLHIGVVAPLNDELGRELLKVAQGGWDPGKVAQILDPTRDAKLIEAKSYAVMERASAFVCIDDVCYMPSHDADVLQETLQMAYEDLAAEAEQ